MCSVFADTKTDCRHWYQLYSPSAYRIFNRRDKAVSDLHYLSIQTEVQRTMPLLKRGMDLAQMPLLERWRIAGIKKVLASSEVLVVEIHSEEHHIAQWVRR